MPNCPACAQPVALPDDAVEGEVLACAACGAELEVLGIDPPELAIAPELAEDWGE